MLHSRKLAARETARREGTDSTLEQKAEHRFEMWDTNADGVLTEDEFRGVAQHVLDAYGASPESTKGKPVMERILGFWARHLEGMDLDDDGRISLDEYRIGLERNIWGNNGVEAVVVAFWRAILDLADESGDGALDASEFVRVMAAFGVSQDDARYTFGGIDGDGKVAAAEWLEALRQFWTSTDPAAPGNILFGRY